MIPPAQHLLVDPSHNRNKLKHRLHRLHRLHHLSSRCACRHCNLFKCFVVQVTRTRDRIDGQTLASHRNPSPRLCPAVAASNKLVRDRSTFCHAAALPRACFSPNPLYGSMYTLRKTTSCACLYLSCIQTHEDMCAIKRSRSDMCFCVERFWRRTTCGAP